MSIRVLIADDQALVRGGFRAILEAEPDIDVVAEAGDGAEALDLARRHRVDVVLMDIRMPRLDGIEATRRLLAEPRNPPTRVLVLTTLTSTSTSMRHCAPGPAGSCSRTSHPST